MVRSAAESATAEVVDLRARLAEAEAALAAIRSGASDAFIGDSGGVFHLAGSEKPYVTFFDAMNEGGVTLDGNGAILHGNPRFADMVGRPIEVLRGKQFSSCVASESRSRVIELIAKATASCEATLSGADGPLPIRLSIKTIGTDFQRFHCLVLTDLSEHAKVETELRSAIARQRAAEAQLRQREHDLRSILDHIPSLVGYWSNDQRNRFGNHAYQRWHGIDSSRMFGLHIREVIGDEQYRLNLPHIEAALRGETQIFERAIPIPDEEGIRHSLTHYIPDVVEGEVQGFYVLISDVTAAKVAEMAIRDSEERLRAMYVNLQSRIEAERRIVSREVHDELGQILTALRMETSLLGHELPKRESAHARLNEMLLLIENMFQTVRNIAGNLRPSTLDLGLVPAIEWLTGEFEKRWQIDCALDIDPREFTVSDDYATAVFRIIQESLTNVVRHAQATSVSIFLRQSPNLLHLEIHDNGCGFISGNKQLGGFGLIGMRERVFELGGGYAHSVGKRAGNRSHHRSSPAAGNPIMISVLIADDHRLVRRGIREILSTGSDMSVIGECANSAEIIEFLRRDLPAVLILDMAMPGLSGVDLIRHLVKEIPQIRILVLSMHNEAQFVTRALREGARGYVTKDADPDILLQAVRKIANDGKFIDPVLVESLVFEMPGKDEASDDSLTDRELQVLQRVVDGKSLNVIAGELNLSPKTISSHKMRIMQKLGVTNNADLVRYALRHDIASA